MSQKISSPRAELSVLRAICSKDKRIGSLILGSVDETYFSSQESIEILEVARKHLITEGEPPSFRIMLEDPDISQEARAHFRDAPKTVDSIETAKKAVKVLNKYRQIRALYNVALGIDREMQKGSIDVDAMLDAVSMRISEARRSRSNKSAFLRFGKNNNSKQFVQNIIYGDNTESVIPTGIKEFDSQAGGYVRGSLVTIGGTSGSGKSVVAGQLSVNMAEAGYRVCLVPLEMSHHEMTSRIIANRSGLDVTKVMQYRLAAGEKELAYEKYEKWVKKVRSRGGTLDIFKPQGDVSIEEIFAEINSLNYDVKIVDYISLLKGVDNDDSWRVLGGIARLAKVNAEATNSVNILLCQINEDGKIRYSRAIGEHSTNSWTFNAKKEEREKEIGTVRIDQPKARNNRSYPFEVGFHWAHMKVVKVNQSDGISDIPEPMKNHAS